MADPPAIPTRIVQGSTEEPVSVEFSQRPSMVEFPKEYQALMNTMEVSLQSFSQVENDRSSHGSDGNEGEKRQGSGKRSSNGAFQEQNNEGEQVSQKDNVHSVESNDTKTSEHCEEASQRMREKPETVGSKCGIGAQVHPSAINHDLRSF